MLQIYQEIAVNLTKIKTLTISFNLKISLGCLFDEKK